MTWNPTKEVAVAGEEAMGEDKGVGVAFGAGAVVGSILTSLLIWCFEHVTINSGGKDNG